MELVLFKGKMLSAVYSIWPRWLVSMLVDFPPNQTYAAAVSQSWTPRAWEASVLQHERQEHDGDHPCACGAYSVIALNCLIRRGITRGAGSNAIVLPSIFSVGTPPRMRGLLWFCYTAFRRTRITPRVKRASLTWSAEKLKGSNCPIT